MELEERIIRFAARCIKMCSTLSAKAVGSGRFADQLFRSLTSIAVNYAEACKAESAKDFVHKLIIAMKELSKTRIWLRLIGEAEYVENAKLADLLGESKELSLILSSSVMQRRESLAHNWSLATWELAPIPHWQHGTMTSGGIVSGSRGWTRG